MPHSAMKPITAILKLDPKSCPLWRVGINLHARKYPGCYRGTAFGVDAGRSAIGRSLATEIGDLRAVDIEHAGIALGHDLDLVDGARPGLDRGGADRVDDCRPLAADRAADRGDTVRRDRGEVIIVVVALPEHDSDIANRILVRRAWHRRRHRDGDAQIGAVHREVG